jgi:Tol biopolymer transport system component
MKWLRNRFLLLPYFVLLVALVLVGCSSKEDPAETLDVSGNHSTGDLVMVTTDTSSDGYHYLNPQLSADEKTILFSADWWAIPYVRDPGDATYVKNRQMILIPNQVGVEPKLNLEEQGAELIVLQETSIPIAGSDFFFTDMANMDKANPIWEDATHVLFSLNTERVGNRMFRADISNPDFAPVEVLYMEESDGRASPPSWQHLEPSLSPNRRWLAFTRSGCVIPDSFETCTGMTIEVLDMDTAVENNGYNGVTYVLTNEYSRIESPKWSSDGTKLIFSGGMDLGGDMGSGTEVYTIDVDTLALEAGNPTVDNNLKRLTFTSLAEGDPIAGVFNYSPVFSEDMEIVYFVSTRRAPTTTLHDRNIWTIPSDGRLEPSLYFFTREDDVDPFIMSDGRIMFSSALGFPTEMLTRLEDEAYQQWVVRNEDEDLGLTEVEMRTLAADEIQNLTFFGGVMSHIYTFAK